MSDKLIPHGWVELKALGDNLSVFYTYNDIYNGFQIFYATDKTKDIWWGRVRDCQILKKEWLEELLKKEISKARG